MTTSLQKALENSPTGGGSGKKNRTKKNAKKITPATTPDYSSSEEESSSSDDDDSSVDTNANEGEQGQQKDSEDMMKIRQQALNLINTPSAGPNAAAAAKKKNSQKFVSHYQQQQQQAVGEGSTGPNSYSSSTTTATTASSSSALPSSYQSSSPYAMHNPHAHPQARTAEELSMTDMFVNCVSDVCKSSSSEIFEKVFSAGYKSVSNYGDQPVSGTWGDSIDTSQHGYGNGNSNKRSNNNFGGVGNMPSRYQD